MACADPSSSSGDEFLSASSGDLGSSSSSTSTEWAEFEEELGLSPDQMFGYRVAWGSLFVGVDGDTENVMNPSL